MGIVSDLGVDANVPSIDIGSFVSNSWIWVLVVVIIGFFLIMGIGVLLFFTTYKKRVIVFENLSGQGYVPVVRTRARSVKFGTDGGEVMKTLRGGFFLSAYGKKMGKNTYWFARGQDGYLYNIILGDLDSKQAMLDIEPVDRDVRMFHTAIDRGSQQTYGKTSFLEKYGNHILAFIFLAVMIFGMWILIGKIGEATAPLAQSQEAAVKVQESNLQVTSKLEGIINNLNKYNYQATGIIPVEVSVNQT